jgi:Ca-activated chloride channel homolog
MPDFQNPAAFFLLLLIPLLFILRSTGVFTRVSFPVTLSDWNGSSFTWNKNLRRFASVLSVIFASAGFIAAVTAFADPVVSHQEKVYTSRGADILFVLDTSPSMAARDIDGKSRLDAAKQAIRVLAVQNSGVSFGIVAMASEAAVSVPPTADHSAFLKELDGLTVGMLGDGSALGTGLSTAVYHLITSSAPVKCIVLITDGENNAGSIHPDTAAGLAAKNGILLYTLAIGTHGTVPLNYVDPKTGKVYSGYLESDFDPSALHHIAKIAGGRSFEIQSVEDLRIVLDEISRRVGVVQTYYYRTTNKMYYDKLILAAAVLFILAWIIRRIYLQEIV